MILKKLEDNKSYHDTWRVLSAVLSASLSLRCGLPSGWDGGDDHQIWRL